MIQSRSILALCVLLISSWSCTVPQQADDTNSTKGTTSIAPIFADGEAQIVPEFVDAETWIRHDLWVETEFDTDGDGKLDRMHVGVTRPAQTETEGLKLPVVYVSSPYFAGIAGLGDGMLWDVKHELGEKAKPRTHASVTRTGKRPIISNSHIKDWVPRGYIVVHSSSPGTGLSQGSPTVGGDNESLAPKAVIDWLCGRIPGYLSPEGSETVEAFWSSGNRHDWNVLQWNYTISSSNYGC